MRQILGVCVTLLAVSGVMLPQAAEGQGVRTLEGQVADATTGRGIDGVEIRVSQFGISTVSDAGGYFRLDGVPGIALRLRFQHIAYGVLRESVEAGTEDTYLRVLLSEGAIELEPITVQGVSASERRERGRGTSRNVITREDIVRTVGTSATLASALERFITGVRLRNQQVTPGDPVCVEFRSTRALDNPNACRPPVIIMDGVRVSNPLQYFSSMPLENVETLEVVPPGEAGVTYGTDSNRGVLLVQTRSGAQRRPDLSPNPIARYDFESEGVPYSWAKTYGAAFLANAAGVALGVAAARSCLTFDNLSDHLLESSCGTAQTVGVRLALVTLPLGGVAYASHRTGRTSGSSGDFWVALVGAALIGAPGYMLSATGTEDGWQGSSTVGRAIILFGMPAAATLADRLFRRPN